MINAELWDKMQHIMVKYNDHMMHTTISFDGKINLETYKKALKIAIDKVPILKHKFYYGMITPKWIEIENFDSDKIVYFKETTANVQQETDDFLLQVLDEEKEAQIKVQILRKDGKDTLNYLLNHMCFDGTDFKNFLKLITDVYNDLLVGGIGDLPCKNGSRDELQLFEDMPEAEQKIAKNLLQYNKSAKHPLIFPFSEQRRDKITPKIFRKKISAEVFLKAKAAVKMNNSSVNDLLCACYIRAIYSIMDVSADQSLGVPNMIDLRRYKNSKQTDGFTNLVSMMICNVGEDIGKDIFETTQKVTADLNEKKKDFPGLHGLPNLRRGFKILPYFFAHFLVGLCYKNPKIGMSNIGIINEKDITLNGLKVEDTMMTGSVKFPPYIQIATTTFRNEMTNTIAVYCNEKDGLLFEKLLDNYAAEFIKYAENKK